jgi:hypothetical protein
MDGLDLRATPTLQLSGQNAAENIADKLKGELRKVEEDPSVAAALEVFTKSEEQATRLDVAFVRLNNRSGHLADFLNGAASAYTN